MTIVRRAEVIEVPFDTRLSALCHQVKNLYNRTNFLFKSSLTQQNYLNYYELNKLLMQEECYKVLPAHVAQHTLKLLSRNWKAFFQAIKEWKRDSSKFLSCPRPPRYKPKDGEGVAIFSNQQAKLTNG